MITFVVRTAQVPVACTKIAASLPEDATTWFVAGISEDGTECAGYLPKDECPEIKEAHQLLGVFVQGEKHPVQRQLGRVWINYCALAKIEPDHGAIFQLHQWQGQLAYRKTIGDAVDDISARLRDIADQTTKTANLLRSLKQL